MRFVPTLAACLALVGPVASAGELYRWVTEDGRVEIGPTPPPGTAAVPWQPDKPEAAQPASPPADLAHAGQVTAELCARKREIARKREAERAEAESEVTRLEHRLESLEASDVAWSRTSCTSQGIEGPKSDCVTSHFDRDVEIDRAEQALDHAREKLDDLELRARAVTPPAECSPASPD